MKPNADQELDEDDEDGLIPCQYIQLIKKADYSPAKFLIRPRRNNKGKLDNILANYNLL